MQIRNVKDNELDQLAEIWNEYSDLITTSKKIVSKFGLINFRKENSNLEYIGVFSQDLTLLGFIAIWQESDGYYINQIAIDSNHHRSGIGKTLIEYSKELCEAKNIDNLKLSVMITNIKALNFFLKIGFEIEDYVVEMDHLPDDHTNSIGDQIRLVQYKMVYKLS